MHYRSEQALEMAVKSAAKASPIDTGQAVTGFYFHRLLCRIFSDANSPFVLKGGHGMLARTYDARATRDIDLISESGDLDAALDELKNLAGTDLGDFVSFEFVTARPIKVEDEYRSGLCVSFDAFLGSKKKQTVSIDLVIDEIPLDRFDILHPADRLDLPGLQTFDYKVHPVAAALADKFCGIIETHDGSPSSRVKDLTDICIYATTSECDGAALSLRLNKECSARKIAVPGRFSVPEGWLTKYGTVYAKTAAATAALKDYPRMQDAIELGESLFNPALDGSTAGKVWNPRLKLWR